MLSKLKLNIVDIGRYIVSYTPSLQSLGTENGYTSQILCFGLIILVTYILLTTLVYCWQTYFEMQTDPASDKPLPPGIMGYPLVGESIHFALKGCQFYTDKLKTYGDIYKTHLLGKPTIRLIGNENIKKVLTGENVIVQSSWPKSVQALLGPGSLNTLSGDDLKRRKMTLIKALGPESLSYLVPEFQQVISSCINNWCKEGDILGYLKCREMTHQLVAKVIFGIDIDQTKSRDMLNQFETFVDNMFCLPIKCPGFGFKKAITARKNMITCIKELLKNGNNNKRSGEVSCVLDVLKNLPELPSVSDEYLIDLLIELIFAGHHTTASVCCSLLLNLGQDNGILGKLREELFWNDLMTPSVDLNFDQINEMTYLENVTKEVLRLRPPVGGGFRKALKTFEAGEFQVPKDWTVIYSIRETHNESPLFHNNQQFLPERWASDDLKVPDIRFHYLPFGRGARSCPGDKFANLTIKIFMIELARRCDWKLHNKSPELVLLPSPYPKDNLPATFTKL